jgi:hypothetical protein
MQVKREVYLLVVSTKSQLLGIIYWGLVTENHILVVSYGGQ